MRQHIDLAWLRRPTHQHWFESTLANWQPGLNRVRVHVLSWLEQPEATNNEHGQLNTQSTHLLASSTVELRRYDALLITVSMDTLVWTRRCLAALPKTPIVPIIGVLDGLQSGAMIDLLELGMVDFVQPSVCAQEFRARLITAVSRCPRYIPLREPGRPTYRAPVDPRNRTTPDPRNKYGSSEQRVAVSQLVWPTIPFQENKQRIIDLFEKQYLQATLRKANGNITEAARLAHKDRRSFWELMRRHQMASGRPA